MPLAGDCIPAPATTSTWRGRHCVWFAPRLLIPVWFELARDRNICRDDSLPPCGEGAGVGVKADSIVAQHQTPPVRIACRDAYRPSLPLRGARGC
jgi:hypothetical protein